MKRWKCPSCLTIHTDAFVRCTECGNKRAERYEVGPDGQWLMVPVDTENLGSIGCYVDPNHPMRRKRS